MGASGFGPTPYSNPDEFERRLREIQEAEAAQDRSRRIKLTGLAITFVGSALIGAALNTLLKQTPDALPANDIAGTQNFSGEPADNSTIPPAGFSGATPVAPEVDAQGVDGLAPQASAETTNPGPSRRGFGPPDEALITSQGSSAAAPQSAAGEPSANPASERMKSAIATTQVSFDSTPRRSGKSTARVAVIPAPAVDRPSPPPPIGTPVKPDREANGTKALRPIAVSVAAPATPADSKPFPTLIRAFGDLLRAFGDLFGALALSARQAIDPAAVTPTSWSVQLGAPRSEAEAKSDRTRLTAKYASALKGSTISERKAIVNGETVYRLRVVGLSKADAEVLCTRLKVDGGNCFIAE
jgi:hypothetical protein